MHRPLLATFFLLALASGVRCQDDPPPETPADLERLVDEASQAEATEIRSEEAALTQRLRSILAAVDDFRGMRVEVEAGIVILAGEAPSRDAAERAVAMAEKLAGVLLVVDDVRVEKGLAPRLREAWGEARSQFRELVASLPLLGAALVILAIAWILARFLRDARFLYRPASDRELLQNLLRQTVFVAVLLAGLVVALRFLEAGAVLGTILGAAGVVGIALGFAFRNVIENYLAGVLLAIRHPFRVRDLVEIDGAQGTVLRMTASETILMDANGNHLRLPNAMVFNGKVLNYTRNPLRRFCVRVGVGTEVDLARAQELGVRTLERMKGVIDDPAPSARIAALGDSSVVLELFGWVDQAAAGYLKVASEAQRLVKEAFDEGGVDMPPPAYQVRLDGDTTLPAREPAPRPAAKRAETGPAPEEIDVSPESDNTQQIEAELARSDEENLLEPEARPARD